MSRLINAFAALALPLAMASGALAQVRDRPAGAPAADAETTTLSNGWHALAAGQRDAAERAAAQILARTPWNHAAMALRIEALASPDPLRGLDAYERWLGGRTREDAALLEPVPRAILRQIAEGSDVDLRHAAVRLLAAAGILVRATGADLIDQLASDAVRARDGDPDAIKRLDAAAAAGTVDPGILAEALESAGTTGTPMLMTMLTKSAGPARAAAAAALGRRKAEEARPMLQRLLADPDPFVRSSVAVALARMGDDRAQTIVDRMLESEVPDLRLMAAEAWNGQQGPWVAAIMPLLDNRDGVTRLQAARLIAPVNPDAARRTLQEAAGDPNPVIRAEAASIMAKVAPTVPDIVDVAQARKLLRDTDPSVRMAAAAVVMAAARAGN